MKNTNNSIADTFTERNNPTSEHLRNECRDVINEWLYVSDNTKDGSTEIFLDEVYHLVNGGLGENEDSAANYRHMCLSLLQVMASPSAKKAIDECVGENFIPKTLKMLRKLHSYFDNLCDEVQQDHLTRYHITEYWMLSDEEMEVLIRRYKTKIEAEKIIQKSCDPPVE